jgi:hypothetical protein
VLRAALARLALTRRSLTTIASPPEVVFCLRAPARPTPAPILSSCRMPGAQPDIWCARRQLMEFPFDNFLARAPRQLRPARSPPLDLPQNLVATPSETFVTLVQPFKFNGFRG